jgi:hypothetical protein
MLSSETYVMRDFRTLYLIQRYARNCWAGWPDVFVKNIAQNVAQYFFVKINAQP